MDYTPRERFRLNAIAVAHAVTYAVSVAVLTIVASFVVGVASGGGAVHAKIFLFVIGWLMMGYAVVRIWPSNSSKARTESLKGDGGALRNSGPSSDSTPDSIPEDETETRFQEAVYTLPPGRWLPRPAPSYRVGMEGKIFLGSVLVLATSFVMEVVFGVGAA
jgi:hypothetical protein